MQLTSSGAAVAGGRVPPAGGRERTRPIDRYARVVIDLARFRADAAAWLAANADRRAGDDNPAALFRDHGDDDAYLAEARSWQARLHDAGWTGISWPVEYGGRGLTQMHEIAWRVCAAGYDLPTEVFGIGLGMAGPTVLAWGTEEQKQRWLRPMLRGDDIWCQMFSEPNAGSDVAGVRTRAVHDDGGWVINGQKTWTSGAHYCRWGLLLARSDAGVPKHRGLTYFVVDMSAPGVEVRPLRQMTGGSNFTEVFFDDVRIPDADVLAAPGMGWNVAVTTLMAERTSIGAVGGLASGTAVPAICRLLGEVALATGANPASDPVLRDRIADIAIRARVVEAHAGRIVAKLERGELPTAEGSVAKLLLTDLLERIATFGLDAQGPSGMLAGDDAVSNGEWAQAFLGSPGMRIAGGTDQIMRTIIGERVLGLPREPRVDADVPFEDIPSGR